MNLTLTTEAKANAIRAALGHQHPDLAALLAMLTSAVKDERETAKKEVRALVAHGSIVIKAETDAAILRDFANRSEPGQIAP